MQSNLVYPPHTNTLGAYYTLGAHLNRILLESLLQVAKLAVSIVMYYCKFLGVDRAEVIKLLIAENAIIDSDAVRNIFLIFLQPIRFAWLPSAPRV